MKAPYSNGYSGLKVGLTGRDIFDVVYIEDLGFATKLGYKERLEGFSDLVDWMIDGALRRSRTVVEENLLNKELSESLRCR